MAPTLVFEIGTEEMPAAAVDYGLAKIKAEAENLLREFRIMTGGDMMLNSQQNRELSFVSPEFVESYGTPRRLVLIVRALSGQQEAATEDVKGPPKQVAFTEAGEPAQAARGFARTQGVDVADLQVREVGGREYVFATKEHPGLETGAVLPEVLVRLAKSLEFAKTMRWGGGRLRFIRPIRWLLALYGDQVVPFELDGLVSGRLTYGHRFLAEGPFEVANADEYEKTMAEAKVVISSARRLERIKSEIDSAAEAAGGRIADYKVLDEVVNLVEDPYVKVGSYDEDFLKIPRAVLVTAMESHQRYFPIEDNDGKLMSLFAVVHNGDPKYGEQIVRGHERVIRARLADAAFFFDEDVKTTLEAKVDRLKGVVWQTKLGTVFKKTGRIRKLAASLADILILSEEQKSKIDRAALLAKADLTTSVVIEFTDLQGDVGREYALVDGEDAETAEAIGEHWRPRFAGDDLPKTITGQVVALADKIDTIAGCFLVGLIPSGSADPYSLRRQAAGIVGILGATQPQIGILELMKLAIDSYAQAGICATDNKAVEAQLRDFIFARLKRALVEAGASADAFEAVIAAGFDVVGDIAARVRIIDELRGKNELEDIKIAFTRCQNLVKAGTGVNVDENLFEHDEERRLYGECVRAGERMDEIVAGGKLEPAIEVLASLREPIDNFFDAVLVMAEDEKVRANRLALLNRCLGVSRRIADFSKLP